MERTRTITWDDPQASADAARTMSGLAFLQQIAAGNLPQPPISQLLEMFIVEVSAGLVVFGLQPAEYQYNPIGTVHGGVLSTILDSAMACAVQSALPDGMIYTTSQLNINFVRPVTAQTGKLYCTGKVINMGRRVATAEGRVLDANDKLYAHGTTTCFIFPIDAA